MPSAPPDSAIVLGADGFLGRHLTARLRAMGWAVTAIGREAGDLADPAAMTRALAAAPAAARLFHLVTRQRTGPVQYRLQGELLAVNARIHLNLLEAWRTLQPQAKLVSAGSSCAFPEEATPIAEGRFQAGPLHPSVRGYGLAKQLLAVGSEAYGAQYGLSWLHLFLATVYGPHDHKAPDRSHFMTALIDRAVQGRREGAATFEVWGDPGTVRDLLHVDDLVDVEQFNDQIDAILAADAAFADRMLNVTANAPVTVGESVAAILDALSWRPRVHHPEGSFRGAARKTLDSTAFLAATGWRPRIGLTAGVLDVLRRDYGIAAGQG